MGAADRKNLGDADIERWIDAFRGPLIGLVASWGATWAVADELAQDAFAEAWVGRGGFSGRPSDLRAAGAWIRGIAWNLWRARRRREGLRAAEPLPEDGLAEPSIEDDARRDALARAFERLSLPHRSVLRMTYLDETTPKQVAALLGLTTKGVESRLYQARKALRTLAEQEARRRAEGAKP